MLVKMCLNYAFTMWIILKTQLKGYEKGRRMHSSALSWRPHPSRAMLFKNCRLFKYACHVIASSCDCIKACIAFACPLHINLETQ